MLGFTDPRARSPKDQIRVCAKIQFWSHSSVKMNLAALFVSEKKGPIWRVLRISENLRSRGQISRSPKIQFWSLNSHFTAPGRIFCESEILIGSMLNISENLRFKIKGQGHHMTKYGQNYSFGSITEFRCTWWQILSMEKTYWGSIKYF